MNRGFNLPIEMNVPIEVAQKADEEVAKDISYLSQKQKKISKEYNNPKRTKLRSVAEYLWEHHQEEVSYEDIAEELEISESVSKIYVASLNFYEGFPMTWIPVSKKAGYIQGSLNNYIDYENWDIKKQRTISTMNQVKEKAERISEGKKKQKKIIIKEEKKIANQ